VARTRERGISHARKALGATEFEGFGMDSSWEDRTLLFKSPCICTGVGIDLPSLQAVVLLEDEGQPV
jgi:hypothetical protein